jgi:hypothetical protein
MSEMFRTSLARLVRYKYIKGGSVAGCQKCLGLLWQPQLF